MFDDTKSVWDLQRANQIAQNFSTSLDREKIARLATNGLVQHFDCTFARIWLVEPDGKLLRLVASSGLYTHTKSSSKNRESGSDQFLARRGVRWNGDMPPLVVGPGP